MVLVGNLIQLNHNIAEIVFPVPIREASKPNDTKDEYYYPRYLLEKKFLYEILFLRLLVSHQ